MRPWRTVQRTGGRASRDGRSRNKGSLNKQRPNKRARAARVEHRPLLRITARGEATHAVVLLLHGGRVDSRSSVRRGNLTVARMRMFAPSILAAAGDAGIAVAVLRNRYRGWNGRDADPVADARWALSEIERRYGAVPVVVVGHSMG